MPVSVRRERINPLTVFDVTTRWGLTHEIKRLVLLELFLYGAVTSMYNLTASTGQLPGSFKEGIKKDCKGPLCWAFLGFNREKFNPLFEKAIDCKFIAANSDTRKSDAKANKTTVLRDNVVKRSRRLLPRDVMKVMVTLGSHDELYLGFGGFKL